MRHLALPACCIVLLLAGCAERVTTGTAAPSAGTPATRMTEQDYEQLMEQIGPAFQALRKNLQGGGNTDDAAKEAKNLAELFGGVEKFWTEHKVEDATKWAAMARTHASNAAGAAAAGNTDKAAASAENMGGACKQCHGTYRESDGQGGYRIKPGVIGR
jgi:cytochrome c556